MKCMRGFLRHLKGQDKKPNGANDIVAGYIPKNCKRALEHLI